MLLVPKLSTTHSSYDTKVPLYFLYILNSLMDFLGIYLAPCSLCIIPSANYVVTIDFVWFSGPYALAAFLFFSLPYQFSTLVFFYLTFMLTDPITI